MIKILAGIITLMRATFAAWNLFWWNHHVSLARMHDTRLKQLDPEWRDKI